jgi:rare lipoprotein A
MRFRQAALLIALPLASVVVSSCGHHRHAAASAPAPPAPPVPPQIHSAETGLASWYGHPYHGRPAANGEIYDMEKFTAAHRTLPFGTWVRVTSLAGGKSVDVRITDRGPFVDGRIIDLSHAAAETIGLVGPGVARVRLDILSLAQAPAAENWYAVQAGAFLEKDRAERLLRSLEPEYGPSRLVLRSGSPSMWRVVLGKERTEDAAEKMARRVRSQTGSAFVVRLDPPTTTAQAPVGAGLTP